MERLSINYYDPAFNPTIADDCTMKVVVGTDGISVAVTGRSITQALKSWVFSENHYEQSIRKILNTNDLFGFPYGDITVSFFTKQQALAPRRMFDAAHATDFLTAVIDAPPYKVFTEEIPSLDSYLVWSPESGIAEICDYFFPKATLIPQAAPLLRRIQQIGNDDSIKIYAHLRQFYLQFVVFERGNLLFFNTFRYEKPADILYFSLLVFDQVNAKPTVDRLILSGELVEDSEIYKQFMRFFRKIEFMPSPTLPGIPGHILPHIYLDHTIC